MNSATLKAMICHEQERQNGCFITGVDINAYVDKLMACAEFVEHCAHGRCEGFIAYYCNDFISRQAFISLMIVAPKNRGKGVADGLMNFVVGVAERRGFACLSLEVKKRNHLARQFYIRHRFCLFDEHDDAYRMRRVLSFL